MQDYTPLGSTASTTVKDGILNHEKNINALRSTYSGTAFPTENLAAGMKCYRTDLGKTYTYNGKAWTDAVSTSSLTVSGETSVPTPATANNSKTIANTEFVHGVVNNLVNGAPTALDTLQELATALGNDPNFSTTILNKIGEKESKTDAQIEHKKLQNEIDLSIKSKAAISADADSKPPTVLIPNDTGMYPIVGYPTGSFDSAINKPSYRHGLVMNFKGQGNELFSLYSVDNKPYLYFRTGYVGWSATWYQIATTEALNALGAKIPAKVSQLTDDVGIAKISNGHLVINGSELWIE